MNKFEEWFQGAGMKFKKASGPMFASSNTPFPNNPYFKPIPPLSHSTRAEIYQKYMTNPTTNSPLNLAKEYKMSVVRINAILRLMALHDQMIANNIPTQIHLSKNMEILLGAGKQLSEPTHIIKKHAYKPLFQFNNDSQTLSPDDAAKYLQKLPFENISHCLNVKADPLFQDDSAKKVLAQDPLCSGKAGFMIEDISNPRKPSLFVREKNGVFRNATNFEKYKKPTPKFFMT